MATVTAMIAKDGRGSTAEQASTELVLETNTRRGGSGLAGIEQHGDWPVLSRLPMRLTASVPLLHFRVLDLVGLKAGQTVMSTWSSTDDVPLKIGRAMVSWSEFEVVEQRLAVRLTRLG